MSEQTINFAEPSLEQLAALRKAAGDEAAQVAFARESAGVRVTVRTTEQPPREWSTQIAPGLDEGQRSAVWDELIARVGAGATAPEPTATSSSPGTAEESRGEVADEPTQPTTPEPTAPGSSTPADEPTPTGDAAPVKEEPTGAASTPRGEAKPAKKHWLK